jgi:hypothetical protein
MSNWLVNTPASVEMGDAACVCVCGVCVFVRVCAVRARVRAMRACVCKYCVRNVKVVCRRRAAMQPGGHAMCSTDTRSPLLCCLTQALASRPKPAV